MCCKYCPLELIDFNRSAISMRDIYRKVHDIWVQVIEGQIELNLIKFTINFVKILVKF